MARFAIAGVLLVFLLAASNASVNPHQSESCRRQVSRMRMDSCSRLLQSQMLFPQMDVQQMQRQCCQELQQVSQDCLCEAVRQIAQSSTGSQGGQHQQQQMQEIMRKAQQLPMMCGMRSPSCEIHGSTTHQSERCRMQLSGVRMDACRRYLQPQMLLLPVIERRQLQQQCCQELQEVNPQCMCEAIRQTVQSLTGAHAERQQQQPQIQDMMRKAQQLPMMCGMRSQSCDVYEAPTNERCRRQIRGARMDSCTRYLTPHILLLPIMDVGQMQQQQCCQELQEVNPECVCEAIRMTVQTLTGSQESQRQQPKQQQVMRKAQQLPRMCGIQAQSCDIRQSEY